MPFEQDFYSSLATTEYYSFINNDKLFIELLQLLLKNRAESCISIPTYKLEKFVMMMRELYRMDKTKNHTKIQNDMAKVLKRRKKVDVEGDYYFPTFFYALAFYFFREKNI